MSDEGGVYVVRGGESVTATPVSPRSNVLPPAEISVVKGVDAAALQRELGTARLRIAEQNIEINNLLAEIDALKRRVRELEEMVEAAP